VVEVHDSLHLHARRDGRRRNGPVLHRQLEGQVGSHRSRLRAPVAAGADPEVMESLVERGRDGQVHATNIVKQLSRTAPSGATASASPRWRRAILLCRLSLWCLRSSRRLTRPTSRRSRLSSRVDPRRLLAWHQERRARGFR